VTWQTSVNFLDGEEWPDAESDSAPPSHDSGRTRPRRRATRKRNATLDLLRFTSLQANGKAAAQFNYDKEISLALPENEFTQGLWTDKHQRRYRVETAIGL
jgi:hypothetical protein